MRSRASVRWPISSSASLPADRAWRIDAGFAPGARGRVFRVRFLPVGVPVRGAVLFVHAFGEEMNKARHVVAHAARQLAARGFMVEVPDLYGCGDSEGTLALASVDGWLVDLASRAHALAASVDGPVHLWGLRAGALLAAALAQRLGDRPSPGSEGEGALGQGSLRQRGPGQGGPAQGSPGQSSPEQRGRGRASTGQSALLLWQPVLRGPQVLGDFLRLRSVAALFDGGTRESVDSLRARLANGETLEVAGYLLTPELATGLEALSMSELQPGRRPVHWFQISRDGQQPIPQAAGDVIKAWRAHGAQVQTVPVAGPAFWSAAELEDCPALIDATTAALCTPS